MTTCGSAPGLLQLLGHGTRGRGRLRDKPIMYDFDQYLQAQWDPRCSGLIANVRNNLVEVSSTATYR